MPWDQLSTEEEGMRAARYHDRHGTVDQRRRDREVLCHAAGRKEHPNPLRTIGMFLRMDLDRPNCPHYASIADLPHKEEPQVEPKPV